MKDSLSELNLDQIEQAIAQCVQQLENTPESAEVYADLGELYAQQQQWQQAVENYQQAISLKPDFAEAHRHLATVMTQRGNDNVATNHLFKAYQLQPSSATAQQHYELGQALERQKKPARAIASYRTAIAAQPNFREVYEALAKLLTAEGKGRQAIIGVYRQGVENNPQDPDYYLALADKFAAGKQWVRASNNYRQAAQLKPSAQIYYRWGLAQYQLKQYEQAQSHFQEAAQLEPSAQIYYHWGLAQYQLRQYEQAQSHFQQAAQLEPSAQIYYYWGLVQYQLRQYEQAQSYFQQAIALQPDHIPAHYQLGSKWQSQQQWQEAIAAYRKVIALNPEPKLCYQLGKLLRAKGFFAEAIAAYCESIKLDPNFDRAYIDLQYTHVTPEQLTQLIDFYRQLVTEHPHLTLAWGNLGDVLTQQDLVSEAIDCYRKASYQKAVQDYPDLASKDWPVQKQSGPDFIIAGVAKAGTSSIYQYLSRHPQVLLSHKKELDFYWQNFERGTDWYLAHFPTITDRQEFITGEATPNYLRFPQVAQRIKNTFPQTKIIILLRNPVDRAISWHFHKLNAGMTKDNLATAIASEIDRLTTVTEAEIINTGYYNPDNIMSGLYVYKIKFWIELLGREQFLILKSEDFYLNPLENMERVFKFLGLPNYPLDNYPQVNAGSYNQVDPAIRATLSEYFAAYNQQLEEYLGMKFDWE